MKIKLENLLSESGYGSYISPEDLIHRSPATCLERVPLLLLEGHMDIILNTPQGERLILERVHPSDHYLGGFLLSEGSSQIDLSRITYSFARDSILFLLSEESVRRLQEEGGFLQLAHRRHSLFLLNKLREARLRHSMSIEEFISYYIYMYAIDERYPVGSFSSLSQILRCDRANLYRGITSLEKRGVVRKTKKELIIEAPSELKNIFRDKLIF